MAPVGRTKADGGLFDVSYIVYSLRATGETPVARKKAADTAPENFYEAVYRLVRKIPKGRVMTYGQIATILGAPRAARAVGYAMKAVKDGDRIPWQRVINRHGQISPRGTAEGAILQKLMLETEGVRFDANEACDLKRYQWEPRNPDRYYYGPSSDAPF